ncbi:hypothetical protein [Clostridium fessum]|uniref:hypothetical protein n=1 Tax=Clostridium fessum TaxID=2126740 RepID=UPI00399A9F08
MMAGGGSLARAKIQGDGTHGSDGGGQSAVIPSAVSAKEDGCLISTGGARPGDILHKVDRN